MRPRRRQSSVIAVNATPRRPPRCIVSRAAATSGALAASVGFALQEPERHSVSPRPCLALERIVSTTFASASVGVSPSVRPSAMSRSRRRMILPDRVLGMSGTTSGTDPGVGDLVPEPALDVAERPALDEEVLDLQPAAGQGRIAHGTLRLRTRCGTFYACAGRSRPVNRVDPLPAGRRSVSAGGQVVLGRTAGVDRRLGPIGARTTRWGRGISIPLRRRTPPAGACAARRRPPTARRRGRGRGS